MKKIFFAFIIAAGCLFSINVSAQEVQDEYQDELYLFLEASGSLVIFDEMVDQVFVMLASGLSDEDKVNFKREALDKLVTLFVPIYKESISLDDLKEFNKFYQTPAGKRIAAAQPVIMSKSTDIGQQWATWFQSAIQTAVSE